MPIPISVIIPTYKASAWIEETLESVVRQTYPADSLEILVVDDASPDDTVSIVRRFLGRYLLNSRVVEREVNAGPGATRNAGWTMARGDWIQFLDQDDQVAPHESNCRRNSRVARQTTPARSSIPAGSRYCWRTARGTLAAP